MPAQNDGSLCFLNQLNSLIEQISWCMPNRLIAGQSHLIGINKFSLLNLGIFTNINQDGSGSSTPRNIKRFYHHFRNFSCVSHKVIMFANRQSNASDVCFLEGITADQMGGNLPRSEERRVG